MVQVRDASDSVVLGRVKESVDGVSLVKNDPGARYTVLTVGPTMNVWGEKLSTPFNLVLLSSIDGTDAVFEGRPIPQPGEEVLLFVTAMDPTFGERYVLTASTSVILLDSSGVMTNVSDDQFHRDAGELKTRDKIVARLSE